MCHSLLQFYLCQSQYYRSIFLKMKTFFAILALAVSTSAFTVNPSFGASSTALFAEKINTKVDLESPKVVNQEVRK